MASSAAQPESALNRSISHARYISMAVTPTMPTSPNAARHAGLGRSSPRLSTKRKPNARTRTVQVRAAAPSAGVFGKCRCSQRLGDGPVGRSFRHSRLLRRSLALLDSGGGVFFGVVFYRLGFEKPTHVEHSRQLGQWVVGAPWRGFGHSCPSGSITPPGRVPSLPLGGSPKLDQRAIASARALCPSTGTRPTKPWTPARAA